MKERWVFGLDDYDASMRWVVCLFVCFGFGVFDICW